LPEYVPCQSLATVRESFTPTESGKLPLKIIQNISGGEYVKNFTNFSCKGGGNFLGCAAFEGMVGIFGLF
jgi:hypothetical protein